jgi:hypothetical protein
MKNHFFEVKILNIYKKTKNKKKKERKKKYLEMDWSRYDKLHEYFSSYTLWVNPKRYISKLQITTLPVKKK